MRIATLSIIVVLLAGAAYLLFGRNSQLPGGGLAPVRQGVPFEASRDPVGPGESAPKGGRAEASVVTEGEAAAQSSAAVAGNAPAADRVRVTGRVLDQEGGPLVGARIQLCGFRWPEDLDVPVLDRLAGATYSKPQFGFETQAGDDGFFSVEGPFVEGIRYWVTAAPDEYHDSYRVDFGRRGRPALEAGTLDLGEIRLADRGAIFGRVTDARGQPIGEVRMGTGPGRSTTYSRGSLTGPDGRYVILHAEVGTYWVKAELDGYLDGSQKDVTVEPGQRTGPVDIVLDDAPWIRGRVIAESGEPVQGAKVYGWPSSSGSGAGARTDENGEFIVSLPQEEPYSMGISHPDYEPWGDERDGETLFDPGTDLGTLTLKRAMRVRFRAVDGESGEALPSFGVSIQKNRGSASGNRPSSTQRPPEVGRHEGGYLELAATAKADLYTAFAEGYLIQTGDVEPSDESIRDGQPAQVLKLQRGAVANGRVVQNGKVLGSVTVHLVPGRVSNRTFYPLEDLAQSVKTDGGGRFQFTGLRPVSPHQLTLTPDRGAPLVVSDLTFEAGEDNDLGDLELVAGGSVVGQVVLPAGLDPGGLTVYRGNPRRGYEQITDSEGRFRFDDVPVGKHWFQQGGRPGEIQSGGASETEVASGETAEVTLDLRDLGLVEVAITVELGGEPAEGVSVTLSEQVAEGTLAPGERAGEARLGDTDASGMVRGSCRGFGDASVYVRIPGAGTLVREDPPIRIVFGAPVEATVSFELASMEFQLPWAAELPDEGILGVTLRGEVAPGARFGGSRQSIRLPIVNGRLDTGHSGFHSMEGETLTLGALGPGTFTAEVFAEAKDAPEVRVQLSPTRWRSGPERAFEFKGQVTLAPGSTVVLELD